MVENGECSKDSGIRQQNLLYRRSFEAGNGAMLCRLGALVVENIKCSKDLGIRQQNLMYCLPFDTGNGECSADWVPW